MQITVTGHQIDVGDSLRGHVQERLSAGISKYFDHAIEGHVAFSHEGSLFRVHIRVHVGKGMTWEAQADDSDIYASFNAAAEHVEKQLRRAKRMRRNPRKGGAADAADGE